MLKCARSNESGKKPVDCRKRLRSLLLIAGIIVVLSIASLTPATAAQKPEQKSAAQAQKKESAPEPSPDNADISISGSVRERELHFEIVPNQKVEFSGTHKRNTESKSERNNLPESVQPGVTYRNIEIRFTITSIFSDIERIVSELLGRSSAPEEKTEPVKQAIPSQQKIKKAEGGARQ